MGQEVKAILVGNAAWDADMQGREDFCRAHLAAFKIPSQWHVQQQPLPRNAAGKIMKNVLSGDAALQLTEE